MERYDLNQRSLLPNIYKSEIFYNVDYVCIRGWNNRPSHRIKREFCESDTYLDCNFLTRYNKMYLMWCIIINNNTMIYVNFILFDGKWETFQSYCLCTIWQIGGYLYREFLMENYAKIWQILYFYCYCLKKKYSYTNYWYW